MCALRWGGGGGGIYRAANYTSSRSQHFGPQIYYPFVFESKSSVCCHIYTRSFFDKFQIDKMIFDRQIGKLTSYPGEEPAIERQILSEEHVERR